MATPNGQDIDMVPVHTETVAIAGMEKTHVPRKVIFSRLWTVSRPEAGKLMAAFTALLFNSTTNLCFPWIMGKAVDGQDGPQMYFIAGTASIFAIGSVASWVRVYCIGSATDRIAARLRKDLFNSLLDRDVEFFKSTDSGDLIQLLEKDIDTASATLTEKMSAGVRSINSSVLGSISLFMTSPKLCAVSLSIVPMIGVGLMTLSKYTRKIAAKAREAHTKILSFALERFSRYSTICLNGKEQFEKDTFASHIDACSAITTKEHFANGAFMSVMNLATNCSLVAVLKIGGDLIAQGSLTNGKLITFAIQSGFVGLGFSGLSSFYRDVINGLDAASRVFAFIDAAKQKKLRPESAALKMVEEDKQMPVVPMNGEQNCPGAFICMDSINFAYASRPDQLVLSNFSVEVPRNKLVCFRGGSGSGKSTLLSIIAGLYSPISGRFLVDGVDMSSLESKTHRQLICTKMFGVVEQASESLFAGSIEFNIRYGKVQLHKSTLHMFLPLYIYVNEAIYFPLTSENLLT